MTPTTARVATPYGDGSLVAAPADAPGLVLLLSHGAGRGIDSPDVEALAAGLPGRGITVVRFEQPWRVAGRKVATPPATLDVGLRTAAAALPELLPVAGPLVVGGRSAGARSAARCAAGLGAVGCLALSFPLHPPGRPERSRAEELAGAGVPTLVVQGERDTMGRPEEFPGGTELVVVPGADHGLKVARSATPDQEAVLALVVDAAATWLGAIAGAQRP